VPAKATFSFFENDVLLFIISISYYHNSHLAEFC
jgi:hypothetical protein